MGSNNSARLFFVEFTNVDTSVEAIKAGVYVREWKTDAT